jgi:hypothetical protein
MTRKSSFFSKDERTRNWENSWLAISKHVSGFGARHVDYLRIGN